MSEEGGEPGPLSREQTQQVVEADRQRAKFVFASRVAGFNGWTMAGCAVLCVPFVFFSPWTALVAAALGIAAYYELHGRARLRELEPGGARVLAINQIVMLLGVYVYCALSIHATLGGPPLSQRLQQDPTVAEALEATGDPTLTDMVGGMDDLVETITVMVYGGVALLSTLWLGAMALFYVSRQRALVAYLAATPEWILSLQRERR